MHWVLGLVGAFLGSLFGSGSAAFLGLVAGAFVGWQGARIAELRRRIVALEQGQVVAPVAPRPIATPVVAPTPRPTVAAPDANPAESATTSPAAGDAVAATRERVVESTPASVQGRATFESREPSASIPPVAPVPAEVRERIAAAASATSRRDDGPAAMPRAPDEPMLGDRVAAFIKRALFEGNVPVKLGMLVLFFGVAAGIKYAVDQGWVSMPIELRLAGFAALAFGALIWGWRNRDVRPAFGLSLQGGAIGLLLLIVFGAFGIWKLLTPGQAFTLVVVLVAGAALLAVLQDAIWLAVLGFVGGYLAPVLISTGSGNHVALFSYYAVLNAAVFGIAWARSWRALNLIGFAFTFLVGTMWGAKYYRPEHFATVEPFLILFFLFYVAIAVLYALRDPDGRRGMVDGTLVFGTPLLAFPLQAALLGDDRMGLAYSALAVASLYALLALWLIRRRGTVLLGQSFAALAVGFATLAVPLALSARWTSASWAVEGVALVWLGLRQKRVFPQFAGWALQGLAGLAYCASLVDFGWRGPPDEMAIINGHALGVLLMSLSAFWLSWRYERAQGHRWLIWFGFLLGTFWWGVAGVRELFEHFETLGLTLGLLAFGAITVVLAGALRGMIPWARLGWIVLAVAASGPLLVLATRTRISLAGIDPRILYSTDPASWSGFTAQVHGYWIAWFVALGFGLWRLREPLQRGLSIAHVLVLASAAWLYGLALHDVAVRASLDDGWIYVAGLLPLIGLLFLTWRVPSLGAFPLAREFPIYRMRWFVPAGFALMVTWLAALVERGGSAPLPFIPLLNPIELFQLVVLVVAIAWARRNEERAEGWRNALPLGAFLFVSFAGLRAVHHLTGAPWSPAILDHGTAQTVLTVLWSIIGVALWIMGSRQRRWNLWLAGAILMGIVLAKLVLVDRQYFGNLAGIVSFMAVGALLVLVGRIAPTPPRHRDDDSESSENGT
jgi:uncharacterized membrane protein